MLRWALRNAPLDTRGSVLYLAANSSNLQLLCQKNCVRFFNSLEEHPRFATEFVQKMSTCIDPDLLGRSTILWWPEVKAQYGNLSTVSPLYSKFRSVLIQDLRKSERLKSRGLTNVLCSVATYMYKSDYSAPPRRA